MDMRMQENDSNGHLGTPSQGDQTCQVPMCPPNLGKRVFSVKALRLQGYFESWWKEKQFVGLWRL